MDPKSLKAQLLTHKGQRMAVISIQGRLGEDHGFRGHDFNKSLGELGDHDVVYTMLDSGGGSVVDAWIIYDYLMARPAPKPRSLVLITGQCSNDAILIPLAFDQILMRPDAYMQFQRINLNRPIARQRATKFLGPKESDCTGFTFVDVLRW